MNFEETFQLPAAKLTLTLLSVKSTLAMWLCFSIQRQPTLQNAENAHFIINVAP